MDEEEGPQTQEKFKRRRSLATAARDRWPGRIRDPTLHKRF